MAKVSVKVPAAHRADLREHLLGLYAVLAESVLLATEGYLRGEASIEPLLTKRRELVEIDRLIEQVGWADAPARTITLTGDASLAAECVQSLLRSAIGALRDTVESSADVPSQVDAARPLVRRVHGLYRLLEATQARGPACPT